MRVLSELRGDSARLVRDDDPRGRLFLERSPRDHDAAMFTPMAVRRD